MRLSATIPGYHLVWLLAYSALFFTACIGAVTTAPCVTPSEYSALYDLYQSTSGQQWDWKSSGGVPWTFISNSSSNYTDPCIQQWQGLTCGGLSGCSVLAISLPSYGLSGTIPPTISGLQNLTDLNLNGNFLHGSLPSSLFNISTIKSLSLNLNALTGPIPPMSAMRNSLEKIDVSSNMLTGPLPKDLTTLSRLSSLRIRINRLNGTIYDLQKLTTLTYINTRLNQFTGSIPDGITMLKDIGFLVFMSNLLTGTIPRDIGSLRKLVLFGVSGNRLVGTIPQIAFDNFKGTMYLSDNMLTGTIPASLQAMTLMSGLWIFNNWLTGNTFFIMHPWYLTQTRPYVGSHYI